MRLFLILLFTISCANLCNPVFAQFGSTTIKQIDQIKNNNGTDIILDPVDKVMINYFTGGFALQSSGSSELQESSVTNTELSYLSGTTSIIQDQLDNKEDLLPWMNDGDLVYYDMSSASALAIGTNGQILTVSGGLPSWQNAPVSTTLTAKGDIQTHNGTNNATLAVGTNGQVLKANSATATGLEWVTDTSSSIFSDAFITVNDGNDQANADGTGGLLLTMTDATDVALNYDSGVASQFVMGEIGDQHEVVTTGHTQSLVDKTIDLSSIVNPVSIQVKLGTQAQLETHAATAVNGELAYATDTKDYYGFTDNALVDLGGGGAGNDLNVATDPSFEKENAQGTCTNCTIAYNTSGVHLASETNTKYLTMTFGASNTGDYIDTYTVDASNNNRDALFRGFIRTTRSDVNLEIYSNSNLLYQVAINNDGNWHRYEIPFVIDSTDIEFKIDATTASTTAIDIDLINFGALPDGYIGNISQAQFVGSLLWGSTNCSWSSTSATLAPYATDADCSVIETIGSVDEPSTKIPAVKILNARTDGTYIVRMLGRMVNSAADSQCRWSLSSSSVYENQQTTIQASTVNISTNTVQGEFQFSTTGDKTIQLLAARNTGTGNCTMTPDNNGGERNTKFVVEFYPNSSDKIVRQKSQLDENTTNGFNVYVATGGTVVDEDFDVMDGNCVLSGTSNETKTCTFTSGIFTEAPIITATTCGNNVDRNVAITSRTSTGFVATTRNLTNTGGDTGFCLRIEKNGADKLLGLDVAGVFKSENIKDGVGTPDAGTGKAQLFSFKFGGAAITDQCTASPCTVHSNMGGVVTGVTRSATGTYSVSLDTSKFSFLNCVPESGRASAAADRVCGTSNYNGVSGTMAILCSSNGAAFDSQPTVICHGVAP